MCCASAFWRPATMLASKAHIIFLFMRTCAFDAGLSCCFWSTLFFLCFTSSLKAFTRVFLLLEYFFLSFGTSFLFSLFHSSCVQVSVSQILVTTSMSGIYTVFAIFPFRFLLGLLAVSPPYWATTILLLGELFFCVTESVVVHENNKT